MGMERTFGLLQERFFWPKMATDIRQHIRNCKRCTHFKLPQESRDEDNYCSSYPLELINLDFLMIGTKSDSNKNGSLLIVTDHFTSYAAACVMPKKKTAPIVAKILWDNFLVNYGWPEKIFDRLWMKL